MRALWLPLALLLAATLASALPINLAIGRTVTGFGALNGVALSTLVDGVFLPEGTGWQSGTVWWNGVGPYVIIDLPAGSKIDSATLQADNNDAYRLSYSADGSVWYTAWDFPTWGGGGMRTRPTPVFGPFTASFVRMSAINGDSMYSLSEIQVFGETGVPEPAAILCMAGGLGLIVLRRRRV